MSSNKMISDNLTLINNRNELSDYSHIYVPLKSLSVCSNAL